MRAGVKLKICYRRSQIHDLLQWLSVYLTATFDAENVNCAHFGACGEAFPIITHINLRRLKIAFIFKFINTRRTFSHIPLKNFARIASGKEIFFVRGKSGAIAGARHFDGVGHFSGLLGKEVGLTSTGRAYSHQLTWPNNDIRQVFIVFQDISEI